VNLGRDIAQALETPLFMQFYRVQQGLYIHIKTVPVSLAIVENKVIHLVESCISDIQIQLWTSEEILPEDFKPSCVYGFVQRLFLHRLVYINCFFSGYYIVGFDENNEKYMKKWLLTG
jgi:hypothetical protein